jgi:hypothetical protein
MNRAPNGEIHLNATKSHLFSLIHQTSPSSILNLLLMAAKRSTSSSLRASDCRVNACWWARTRRFSSMVRCCLRTSMKFLKPWELAGVMCRRAGCCVAGGRGLLARCSCRCSCCRLGRRAIPLGRTRFGTASSPSDLNFKWAVKLMERSALCRSRKAAASSNVSPFESANLSICFVTSSRLLKRVLALVSHPCWGRSRKDSSCKVRH